MTTSRLRLNANESIIRSSTGLKIHFNRAFTTLKPHSYIQLDPFPGPFPSQNPPSRRAPPLSTSSATTAPTPATDTPKRHAPLQTYIQPNNPIPTKFRSTERRRHPNWGYNYKHRVWVRGSTVWTPSFIVRRFNAATHEYMEQVKWGQNWGEWEANVAGFDPNEREWVEAYNGWLGGVVGATEEGNREALMGPEWCVGEVAMLRAFVNEVVFEEGLERIVGGLEWEEDVEVFNGMRGRVEELRGVVDRSVESVKRVWELDSGIQRAVRMGLTLRFREMQGERLPDDELKPRDLIPILEGLVPDELEEDWEGEDG